MGKIKITTNSGFTCSINESAIEDIRVFRAIRNYEKGDKLAVIDTLDYLFTDRDRARLEKHIETKDGYRPLSAYAKEATEIFNAVLEKRKNLSSSPDA